MDYNNINLKSEYERGQSIIDALSFDALLLEVSCNIRTENLNKEGIMKQFNESLQSRINSAKDIMSANIDNLLTDALEYRFADGKSEGAKKVLQLMDKDYSYNKALKEVAGKGSTKQLKELENELNLYI